MFKRKRKTWDNNDFGLGDPSGDYGDSYQEDTLKKKRGNCLTATILISALIIGGLFFGILRSKTTSTEKTPATTPTVILDGDDPIATARGLVYISYNVMGEQTGVFDLHGKQVSDGSDATASIPVTVSMNSLSRLDSIEYPQGVFFDPQSGQLVVFGPPARSNAHPSSDDFLVALRSIYSQQDPAVSIDPAESLTTQNVRYLGQTEGTHFGWVMFEADRLMKTLSMGRDNVTDTNVTSSVSQHGTLLDFEFQLGDTNQREVRRRFWFRVPVAEIEQSGDGKSMSISALSMDVQTEYLDSNWQTLPNQPTDPAGQAFASQLTTHYDEYAREFPVLADLRSLAHWVALVHWIQQTEQPFSPDLWLAQQPIAFSTPLTTPAITVEQQHQEGNTLYTLSLWGGVDLGMKVKVTQAEEATVNYVRKLSDQFRASLLPVKIEQSISNIEMAPITPMSLESGPIVDVQTPGLSMPGLRYSSTGWEFQIPKLQINGQGENINFVLTDPALSAPVALTYWGPDAKTNKKVFINHEAGFWLVETQDGYQLIRGKFVANDQFSYEDGNFIQFNKAGQIQNSTVSGSETTYSYRSGLLTSIQQGSQGLEILRNEDGTIKDITSGEINAGFQYADGRLTGLVDSSGKPWKTFEYDSNGYLTHIYDAGGNMELLVRYDSDHRLLLKTEGAQTFLYDWGANGELRRYSGDGLSLWQNAKVNDLKELTTTFRLSQTPEIKHIFFVRQIADQLIVQVDDQSLQIPSYMLNNPSRLRTELKKVISMENWNGDTILISNGSVKGVSFQSLFPNAMPVNVETMDERRIASNVRSVFTVSPPEFTSQSARVINGVPLPEQLQTVGLEAEDASLWQGLKQKLDLTISQPGFAETGTAPGAEFKAALSTSPSVLVVVAHSDGQQIYFPDGTVFNPDVLSKAEKQAILERHPLVIVLSCDTAVAPGDSHSFAQRLLDVGPQMVIAPTGKLPVDSVNSLLQTFFQNLNKESNVLKSFWDAILKTYPDGLIPNSDDNLEHYFEFLTRQNPQLNLESNSI